MSYYSKIEQSKKKVYNHAIATKILDLMDKLRLDENEDSSRRWIWELLQNAKDVAHKDIGLSIEINFQAHENNGYIEFKHNGMPFSIDNLTFLIEQVSTKERKTKETTDIKSTGKFGTGFLTTHLLSEIVEVESIVMEPGEPCKKFNLLLDRSGRDIREIIDSVNKSLESLENIDKEKPNQYLPYEFNTIFRYKLDENGIEVAKKGLNDLHISLLFTLAFLPEIKSIKIINEDIKYELSQEVFQIKESNIKIYTIIQDTPFGKLENKIALLTYGYTSIAIEIEYKNEQIFIKEPNPFVPRLFCDFPLVGTEDFPFPVIINNPFFNPNEQRNGVYITNKLDSKVEQNKSIIIEAVSLYNELIDYASYNNWSNIHVLARIPTLKEMIWLSKKWLESEVLNPVRGKLLVTPIIDTEDNGRQSILNNNNEPNIWFPSSPQKDIRSRIWDLANLWIPKKLPRKADIDIWYNIKWLNYNQLSLKVLTQNIENKGTIKNLGEALVNSANLIDWLNSYFQLINLDEEFITQLMNDKYIVIPNQYGKFKKRSDLKIDKGIEEELKNTLLLFNIDCRDYLKHANIYTGQLKYYVKNQDDIIIEINKFIKEGTNENVIIACHYIVTLFSNDVNFPKKREKMYQICKAVYPEIVNIKRTINKWSEEIWQEADKMELKLITNTISKNENIITLTDELNLGDKSVTLTLNWLNNFISFLIDYEYDNLLNLKKAPILPNQNGNFRNKDDLFLDNGDIDENLKDISAELGYDFRDELLDVNVYLDLPDSRIKNQIDIAEEIIRLITPRIAELPRTDETRQIFRKLYLWFNNNKEKAEKLFGELYVNKHRLYDDDEIAENMQKAEILSSLMEEYGIDDLSTLRQVLQTNKTQNLIKQREEITQSTLVSLGVTSIEELEEALKDKDIAAQFTHISTPTVEMFCYAQSLISRAKKNVITYLKTLINYDCSQLEELATTVIGGIQKDGTMIHVVVRPSDNGEVIIYYSSEKDTLDYANAELWIDNGLDEPSHLTLGRILKTTGINRIPV